MGSSPSRDEHKTSYLSCHHLVNYLLIVGLGPGGLDSWNLLMKGIVTWVYHLANIQRSLVISPWVDSAFPSPGFFPCSPHLRQMPQLPTVEARHLEHTKGELLMI